MLGGVLFLLPLAIVAILPGHVLRLVSTVAEPISKQHQLQQIWGGLAVLVL